MNSTASELLASVAEEARKVEKQGEEEVPEERKMHQRGVKRRSIGGSEWEPKRSRYDTLQHHGHRRLTPHQYQQMTAYINMYFANHIQNEDVFQRKMKLRHALSDIAEEVFTYCSLHVVGSSVNGFGSNSSDMDMCLMLPIAQLDQKREATKFLRKLHKALQKCTYLKQLQLIRAAVPILKFTDRISKVECDINVNNTVGIRNTHLLNAYSKMDDRLAPLAMFAKHWAKYHNINDASRGTISSYSLVLMVIHFLQHGVSPPVLPCLQQDYPHRFGSEQDVLQLDLYETPPTYSSQNTMSQGELFLAFLHYYTKEIDFHEQCISIRLGKLFRTMPYRTHL